MSIDRILSSIDKAKQEAAAPTQMVGPEDFSTDHLRLKLREVGPPVTEWLVISSNAIMGWASTEPTMQPTQAERIPHDFNRRVGRFTCTHEVMEDFTACVMDAQRDMVIGQADWAWDTAGHTCVARSAYFDPTPEHSRAPSYAMVIKGHWPKGRMHRGEFSFAGWVKLP